MRAQVATGVAAVGLLACTAPQEYSPQRAAWDEWAATVQVIRLDPLLLNGACGYAPPSKTANVILLADPAPVGCEGTADHEKAHVFAYQNDIFMGEPGEPCVVPSPCPGAERAAEAILAAVGLPTSRDPELGYGRPGPAYIEQARQALWRAGL